MSTGSDTFFKTERRAFAVEVRAVANGRWLEGYAAVFNSEARFAGFSERIAPGAFRKTLDSGQNVLALVDHDASKLLARTRSGTLRLAEDTRGLSFAIAVPDTSLGRDVLALAQRGDIGGASFAFIPLDEHWEGDQRELRSVELKEISVVQSWPAYPQTEVTARSRSSLFPIASCARRFIESL
jgi:Escherichia/Staphylococcus phage prohead protease